MTPAAWIEVARGFGPVATWLDPGPRLFAAPDGRAAWTRGVRALLRAHPSLRTEVERRAEPRAIRETPSGWVDPRQYTACLPAAALLALVDTDPARLAGVRDRIPAVLALADWVPPHHAHSRPLDLSAAGAIGDLALHLDLARDLLPADERRRLAEAIDARGVRPFARMCAERTAFWTRANHNWPTVIAGQVGLGLLAAWEGLGAPAEALPDIVERIAGPLLTYPEDGSYEEGPGYWHYGLGECLPFCWAMWLASGGAVDLFALPFLRNTARYAQHVRTPDGGCFQVEDGAPRWSAGWMLAILGRRFGDAAAIAQARATSGSPAGGSALHQALFGEDPGTEEVGEAATPTMAFFPGTQNVMLRSDWRPAGFFAGLHAGSNGVNHAHLDLGTFTVVAGGQPVMADSGSWAYTLDYFQTAAGGRRWDYEPNTTAGHNALLVDGGGQEPGREAHCRFHQVELHPEQGLAVAAVDLTGAYGGRLARYVRHFAYVAEGLMLVVDEIACDGDRRLAWCGHPTAPPEPVPDGWRWGEAELRLHSLRDDDGFVLSEARRRTRYVDRVGQPREYTTHAVRAATLHRVRAWTVVAALTVAPDITVDADAPSAVRVSTPRRGGVVSWAEGQIRWVGV